MANPLITLRQLVAAVVSLTDIQTLTNKTLTTPTIGSFVNATHTHAAAASGGFVSHATASNVLGADVALNNTATTFTGPSMAQGTSGTWFASGSVRISDGLAGSNYIVFMTDGTTTIASTYVSQPGNSYGLSVTLTGIIANPAGNIRMTVRDVGATTGAISANISTGAKDSAIWGIRIA